MALVLKPNSTAGDRFEENWNKIKPSYLQSDRTVTQEAKNMTERFVLQLDEVFHVGTFCLATI